VNEPLNYRERFELTLSHREVDRPPMDLASTDMTHIEGNPRVLAPLLGVAAGLPEEQADEAVLKALGIDFRGVGGILAPTRSLAREVSPTYRIDAWGIGYEFNGHHFEAVGRPLADATIDDLNKYPWPDANLIDRNAIERMRQRAQYLYEQTPYVVCGRHPYFGVLELGCWMCGFEDFLYRLAGDQEFVQRFFQIILAYQKQVNEIYYGALGPYLHLTTSGDDFGTQTGPFLSPAMFRELIVPYFAERVRHMREYTKAHFFHHTCGSVFELIPDLMSLGVEILNPIQPHTTNMEPDRLKRAYGDRLTFWGGVDTQHLLPHGTPEEVWTQTRGLMDVLGKQGGHILSAAHCLQEDVPLKNVLAMYAAGLGREIGGG